MVAVSISHADRRPSSRRAIPLGLSTPRGGSPSYPRWSSRDRHSRAKFQVAYPRSSLWFGPALCVPSSGTRRCGADVGPTSWNGAITPAKFLMSRRATGLEPAASGVRRHLNGLHFQWSFQLFSPKQAPRNRASWNGRYLSASDLRHYYAEEVPCYRLTRDSPRLGGPLISSAIFARAIFSFSHELETELVWEFLGAAPGFFVDVGANDPKQGSQSWHLEQRGWNGILIEPQPELAEGLRQQRKAKVYAVACSSPANAGKSMPLYRAGPFSSLDKDWTAKGRHADAETYGIVDVPIRTLD